MCGRRKLRSVGSGLTTRSTGPAGLVRQHVAPMRSLPRTVIVVAAIFALFHIVVVAIPVLLSGGSGQSQAFAAAIVDFPISWLLGLFPSGRAVLYGSSPWLYMLLFGVGGPFMYATVGALVAWGMYFIDRVFRAA